MNRFPLSSASRVLGLMLALFLVTPDVVLAAGVRNERAVINASHDVVAKAAHGELDAAFAEAAKLGQERDAAFPAVLNREKQAAASALERLGAVRSVSTPDDLFFAGCITRSYLVRHAQGTSRWMLKWRRGSDGWYLKDLAVSRS